jgi:histidinol-phosphate/aromatic aminotransferase/cobyric acid decarboxylase-like protein
LHRGDVGEKTLAFWSPIVHSLSPYVPGEQPKLDGMVKLNTNENPCPPSPRVLAAIAAATDRCAYTPIRTLPVCARRSRPATVLGLRSVRR